MDKDLKALLMPVILLIFFVVFGLSHWVVRSYFEAQAYNRITGSNVSTWDAMYVELRVEGNSK